jgi:sialate O-acetylesterase
MKRLLQSKSLALMVLFAGSLGIHAANIPVSKDAVKPKPAIELGAPFADNAILQRDMDLPVWGWRQAGTTVTVAFSGQKKTTTVGDDGKWVLKLDPLQANARPQAMVVSDSSGKTETLNNMLVGEVWLCSGQSNMDWKLKQLGGRYDQDIAQANDPKLRLCVVRDIYAAAPQQRHAATWNVCTPDQAQEFSAVAFFFGAKLLQELDVPIGLIESARGGSPVEAWMREQTLRQGFPEFNAKLDTFPAIVKKTGGVFAHRKQSKVFGITQTTPAVLYNGYIHPLIPFAIRGAIWYQGESNVKRPEQYRKLFPAMIRQWRADWNQGDFPFYYVQIAPCGYKDLSAAYLREAQMMTLSAPHTGMAVTMDLGDKKTSTQSKKSPWVNASPESLWPRTTAEKPSFIQDRSSNKAVSKKPASDSPSTTSAADSPAAMTTPLSPHESPFDHLTQKANS